MMGIWETIDFTVRVLIGSADIIGIFSVFLGSYLLTVFFWSWYVEHKAHKRHRRDIAQEQLIEESIL